MNKKTIYKDFYTGFIIISILCGLGLIIKYPFFFITLALLPVICYGLGYGYNRGKTKVMNFINNFEDDEHGN